MLLRLRTYLAGEGGYTMLVTMGVLAVCAGLTAAAFGAAVGDIPLRKESREKKVAYAAAEAGINFYLSRLNKNVDYWTKCTDLEPPNASGPIPVNQRWDGAGADPRVFRTVPGEPGARYTVELLPAVGSQCSTTDPSGTMRNAKTGELRLRATGIAGSKKRSVIVALRPKSFLDYLYFTDYETSDPSTYTGTGTGVGSPTWAETNCRRYRASRSSSCREIQFSGVDSIKGPFHTNDDILHCGGSTFGRPGEADRLEASGPKPGYANSGGCSGAPVFNSTWQPGVPSLAMPQTNAKITSVAVAPYVLTGTHDIVLNGGSMTVTPKGQASYTLPLPANGVVWVKDGTGCGAGLSPLVQNYLEPTGCANVTVSGSYANNLTLVSDKDIIVDGDLRRSGGNELLGLIATNFVRVYHPVAGCVDQPGTMTDVTIQAAIMTLQHSFIVDNYDCGSKLGILRVEGAIVQRFRGPVGTTRPSGYTKDYNYDSRLKYRNPPSFLDPVSAAWRLVRQNEQVPAR